MNMVIMFDFSVLLTNENNAATSFCDSPNHLSLREDTWTLIKRHPVKLIKC